MIGRVTPRLTSAAREEKGTVTIEFVITFPLLIMWIFLSYVLFDVFRAESHANKALFMVSDVISRAESISTAELDDNFILLDKLLPLHSDDKWMRTTSIAYDHDTDTYEVLWSHVTQPDDFTVEGYTDETLPAEMVLPTIRGEDSIVLVEIAIPHSPIIDNYGFTDLAWTPHTIVRPRFIAKIVCTDCEPVVVALGD